MKIGVYVGSFDPFHKGHENIIYHLLNKKYIDKVIIIPTLSYWDKNIKTSLNDRINMIKTIEDSNIEVNDSSDGYVSIGNEVFDCSVSTDGTMLCENH